MKIKLLTLGSRGDVQPFVALGQRLRRLGHEVTVITAEQFADFVKNHDLAFAPVSGEFLSLIEPSNSGATAELGKTSTLDLFRRMRPIMRDVIAQTWEAVQGADAIVFHPKTLIGVDIAEKLQVSAFRVLLFPDMPTTQFAYPAVSNIPNVFNKFTYLINRIVRLPFAGVINDWRESVGLPKKSRFADDSSFSDGTPVPHLYPVSKYIVPPPPDYPEHAHVTGYWFLDQEEVYSPPQTLIDFINAGTPPIYIGFGSMPSENPREKGTIITRALERTDQRAVVATGHDGLQVDTDKPNLYPLDYAPHEWLFPQMAAVMHHGGAGTTAAGLRAGVPTIVAPFFGDQPFWGKRIQEAGVGPKPIPQKRLTIERVASAFHKVINDADIKSCANQIGQRIRAENGLDEAVNLIHKQLQRPKLMPV